MEAWRATAGPTASADSCPPFHTPPTPRPRSGRCPASDHAWPESTSSGSARGAGQCEGIQERIWLLAANTKGEVLGLAGRASRFAPGYYLT